ncbi:MAG: ABC transporter ATP-binding protein [Clostridiales bacterium]|jgi:oligopeptide transport system ATP-binding protein|nr:ABC transporter ATP-binding protein [Clostridiales bacterium]
MSLLEIEHLTTEFATRQGVVRAVRDVSYSAEAGEILGLVGESGSGKSVGMLTLMGLLESNGRVPSGRITFDGRDISPSGLRTKRQRRDYEMKMRAIRGNEIGMIFQDPMTYLNPILTIRRQMTEGIVAHSRCSADEAERRAVSLMGKVGIPSPRSRLSQYPFEFSGGMRQRIIIAIALSMSPKLVIADEPTTALDVTVQAQILELIRGLALEYGTAVALITHDLGVVASMCDRVLIMYAGMIVEEGTADEIFYEPRHPYTLGLLGSINRRAGGLGEGSRIGGLGARQALTPIPGSPPDLLNLSAGCAFLPRCRSAMRVCAVAEPGVSEFSASHRCRCWLHDPRNPGNMNNASNASNPGNPKQAKP